MTGCCITCATGANIGVLAKIESAESVGNLNAILDAVDGAMVARGDLGAELPVEEARGRWSSCTADREPHARWWCPCMGARGAPT